MGLACWWRVATAKTHLFFDLNLPGLFLNFVESSGLELNDKVRKTALNIGVWPLYTKRTCFEQHVTSYNIHHSSITMPLQWKNSLKITNLCLNVFSAFLLVSVSSLSNALSREPPPPPPATLFVFDNFPAERRKKFNIQNKNYWQEP